MGLEQEDKVSLREKQITFLVKTYYEKFDFLQFDPLDLLVNKALALYLNSPLSIDEINEKMLETIMERRKALYNKNENKNIAKDDLNNMLDNNQDNNMKERGKAFVKEKNQNDEGGFVAGSLLTTITLITFVTAGIGLVITYLLTH